MKLGSARRTLPVIALAAVVVASFYLLSFRLMRSSATSDSVVASSSPQAAGGQPVQPPGATILVVEGEGRLEQALRARLLAALSGQPALGAVRLAVDPAGASRTALLVVTIKEQRVSWLPVRGQAALQVVVAYASDGDVSFREVDPPHFQSDGGSPSLQLLGKYALADVSTGLVSLPGYQDYLATVIAQAIAGSLRQQSAGWAG